MCGIAGIFDARGVSAQSAEAVSRMTAAQTHRGPDADGLYVGERAVLGHRRLSILDLSDAGRQPMSNEDGSIWIVFNGEIYNYRELRQELIAAGHAFRSGSDTEVLIHGYEQWGIERLLGNLRGMFAFALYDVRNGLTLARDRLGIKPLYYYRSADTLIFASEVKALLHSGIVPGNSDPEALIGFLLAGSVPAPLTTVQGVKCLEPGHYLVAGNSGCVVRKYWDLDTAARDAGESGSARGIVPRIARSFTGQCRPPSRERRSRGRLPERRRRFRGSSNAGRPGAAFRFAAHHNLNSRLRRAGVQRSFSGRRDRGASGHRSSDRPRHLRRFRTRDAGFLPRHGPADQ